jgi:hypothetical protein
MKYYTTTTEYNRGIDPRARQMYACVMRTRLRAGAPARQARKSGRKGSGIKRTERVRH